MIEGPALTITINDEELSVTVTAAGSNYNTGLPEEHQQMLAEMRKQGDVTLEILNALLNWGEAQLKGVHIEPATFQTKASIEKNITALHQQAKAKSITIADHTPADLAIYGT